MYDPQNGSMYRDSILYSSEGAHGDQVEIVKRPDGFYACAWTDGSPDRGAAGGYDKKIPDDIISDFRRESMNAWLRFHFWTNTKIRIQTVCSEEDVQAFISAHGGADQRGGEKADGTTVSAEEYRRAAEDAGLYHRKKIVVSAFCVLFAPALFCGLILNIENREWTDENIAFLLFALLLGLFTAGYSVYAAVMERSAKRVIARFKGSAHAEIARAVSSKARSSADMTFVPEATGYFVRIPGAGTETNVSYQTILRGDFESFCSEQKSFSDALYKNGYRAETLKTVWETLKEDFAENRAKQIHAEESAHLHFLETVNFIPPRVREGEHEYFAIDDRDDQPYYVVDAPVWWAQRTDVREFRQCNRITYDDVRKTLSSHKFADLNAENWRDRLTETKSKAKTASHTAYDRVKSEAEEDAAYMHVLGSTALCAEPIYGKCEYVAVDERENKAYYIITQTDGRVSEATHYHTKQEIPFAEIPDKYLGDSFTGINETNWRQYKKQTQ